MCSTWWTELDPSAGSWLTDPVRAVLLLALSSLAGCEPLPDGCADRSEAFFRLDAFGSDLPVPPDGVYTGSFVAWQVGEAIFETLDGARFGFGLVVEGAPLLPDLGALGTIDLQARGFITDSTEPTSPLIEAFSPGDRSALLAVLGNRELVAEGSVVTLRSPRDDDTCMQYGHEDGRARNKPAFVGMGDQQATLFQAEALDLGDLTVSVVTAQSNNRSHPWAPCRDALCPWEKLAWTASRDGLAPLGLPPGEAPTGDDGEQGGAAPR